jgi:uncharacterized LabA/DUF88 family protein
MQKIVAYIDALNLYHSLKENNWAKYYWLDIPSLINKFVKEDQRLEKIYYFTTIANKSKSQITYIEALQHVSVTRMISFSLVKGRFEQEDIRCNNCGEFAFCKECEEQITFSHEKETDVNISVQMLSDAYEENFDIAYLLTEDSDQVGTIKTIKNFFRSSKKVGVIFPPRRKSNHLINVSDFHLHISQNDLGKNQLPEKILKSDGYILKRPDSWH